MSKSIYIVLISFTLFIRVNAQVVIPSTATADGSAELTVVSTSKGILVPIMTNIQKLSILCPDSALLIYNSSNVSFDFYNGLSWEVIGTLKQYTTASLPIATPKLVPGQLIYNTSSVNNLNFYDGTSWYHIKTTGVHIP